MGIVLGWSKRQSPIARRADYAGVLRDPMPFAEQGAATAKYLDAALSASVQMLFPSSRRWSVRYAGERPRMASMMVLVERPSFSASTLTSPPFLSTA